MRILRESGLSRIYQKTKDMSRFAIIGSVDKDTKKDRFDELYAMVRNLAPEDSDGNRVGWTFLRGTYTYEDGTTGTERSILISNISKYKACELASKERGVNQESIIWKDKNFFGFLTPDGKKDGEFSNDEKNMNFTSDDIKLYGSKIDTKHNSGQPFMFEMFVVKPKKSQSSIRNMGGNKSIEERLFKIDGLY